MPVLLSALDHVAIRVKDLAASAQWYSDVFGFTVLHRWDNAWMLQRDSYRLGIYSAPTGRVPDDPDSLLIMHHYAFLVTAEAMLDAEVVFQELAIPYQGPKDSGLFLSLFVTDPDGHKVELLCFPRSPAA